MGTSGQINKYYKLYLSIIYEVFLINSFLLFYYLLIQLLAIRSKISQKLTEITQICNKYIFYMNVLPFVCTIKDDSYILAQKRGGT